MTKLVLYHVLRNKQLKRDIQINGLCRKTTLKNYKVLKLHSKEETMSGMRVVEWLRPLVETKAWDYVVVWKYGNDPTRYYLLASQTILFFDKIYVHFFISLV